MKRRESEIEDCMREIKNHCINVKSANLLIMIHDPSKSLPTEGQKVIYKSKVLLTSSSSVMFQYR